MRYDLFAGTGKKASRLCFGTAHFGEKALPDSLAFEMLDAFIELGGNAVDTARVYGDSWGDSEKALGRYLAARGNREALVIGTKGGHPRFNTMTVGRLDAENLREDMAASLDALGVCPDIYWLHRDDASRPVGDILDTLNGFVEAGYTKALGVSNWTPARIAEANAYAAAHSLVGFTANQPQWSLARMVTVEDPTLVQLDADMYAFHKATGMACMPYSSQAKGFFIKLSEGRLTEKARRRYACELNARIYERVVSICEKSGLSIGAAQLAFLTSQPFPVFPIVGVSGVSQVEALAEAADAFLAADDADALARDGGLTV